MNIRRSAIHQRYPVRCLTGSPSGQIADYLSPADCIGREFVCVQILQLCALSDANNRCRKAGHSEHLSLASQVFLPAADIIGSPTGGSRDAWEAPGFARSWPLPRAQPDMETEVTIAWTARRSLAGSCLPSQIITVNAAGSGRVLAGGRLCPSRRQIRLEPQS